MVFRLYRSPSFDITGIRKRSEESSSVPEKCDEELVFSQYVEEMKAKRQVQQQKALQERREPRSKKEYKEDLARGHGRTKNITNHALWLEKKIYEMQMEYGYEQYRNYYNLAKQRLINMSQQESTLRYQQEDNKFVAAMENDNYEKSEREKETGVDETPLMKGEVPIFKCKKKDRTRDGQSTNYKCMVDEAVARGIYDQIDATNGNLPNYKNIREAIRDYEKGVWIRTNPGKEVPEKIGHFIKPLTNARFTWTAK